MLQRKTFTVLCLMLLWAISVNAQGRDPGPEGDHHVRVGLPYSDSPHLHSVTFGTGPDLAYHAGPSDEIAWNLQERIKEVRAEWGAAETQRDRARVQRSSTEYGLKLSRIPDRDLELGGRVIKEEYSCYARIIAAETSDDKGRRLALSNQAQSGCRSALNLLHFASHSRDHDPNAATVADWAKQSDELERVEYLLAMASCLNADASGNESIKSALIPGLQSNLSADYLKRFPPERDIVLSRCKSAAATER